MFKTVIRSSIAYAESAEKARSILDHRPDLGADYLALADELLKRIGLATPGALKPLLGKLASLAPEARRLLVLAAGSRRLRRRRSPGPAAFVAERRPEPPRRPQKPPARRVPDRAGVAP